MSTYCECGDVATVFYNDQGDELTEPMCNECYAYSCEVEAELFGRLPPPIVCLCGSTRFSEAFQQANLKETLEGKIVLTIGCDTKSDNNLFASMSPQELTDLKDRLDWLHLRKIDLADEVLILNVGGYIGDSTRKELEYARQNGKRIRFLEPEETL